jgi:hypothetical protein
MGRPEKAPQRLETTESAPGIGTAPEASNPQDVAAGWGAAIASRCDALTLGPLALDAPLAGRPKMARQRVEKIEFAPGTASEPGAPGPQDAEPMRGEASLVSPTAANPSVVDKRPNVRAMLNGVVAF